jgi:hypothetical protein
LRGTPQQAFAQAVVPITDGGSDAYKVSYFDVSSAFVKTSSGYGGVGSSGGSGDALLRIVDAGNWEGGNAGDVCANIYVFNDTQEEAECCSCPLTANSLMTFSVINQLTRNPFSKTTESLSAGVIKIVGSKGAPCVTGCFATTAQGPYTIAGGLHEWINHTESVYSELGPITSGVSVEEFTNAGLDSGELNYLQSKCAAITGGNVAGSECAGICDCGKGS